MQVSHSRLECFESCPFKYRLRYIENLITLKPENADNALVVGTALHEGVERTAEESINEYFQSYTVITDDHINEAIKLEIMIPRVKEIIPDGQFEVLIDHEDFKGYIDLLANVRAYKNDIVPNVYDMYDFKYSSNKDRYKKSVQLHLYKYFYEKLHPGVKIRKLIYLCIPKVNFKQRRGETLSEHRRRVIEACRESKIEPVEVEYDESKVLDWMIKVKNMVEATEFPKNESRLCAYCEYYDYCQKGWEFMILPKNERRKMLGTNKKVLWIYGAPFSGKTTFANRFPDPLMLNTDGNIKFVDAPYLPIRDEVEVVGRITKRTMAWEVFKNAIAELEKKDNDFKTIVIDLLEDLYEYCRLYMYVQMGITHESDDSFKAWDKVRVEFLSTLKRLMSLDYENIILISHEDTSKDITKKGGDKITAIKPNMQDKVASKVAGMVDIVARVVADGKVRTLSFKSNEVIFGGGRILTEINEIPLDYEAFLEVYKTSSENQGKTKTPSEQPAASTSRRKSANKPISESIPLEPLTEEEALAKQVKTEEANASEVKTEEATTEVTATEEVPTNSTETTETATEEVPTTDETPAEAPKTRVRKRRE